MSAVAAATPSEITLFGIIVAFAVCFGLAALPYILLGTICAVIALVLAVVGGIVAFVAVETWILVAPVVVPVSLLALEGIRLITRLAILCALAWAGFKLVMAAVF